MKNIAIIGSGISGLTCAYMLNKKYDISVFEQNDYIGGHTATKDIEYQGDKQSVDTGFIVFNDRTYPLFEKLLDQIGIGRQATQMSFSVKNTLSGLEYNGNTLNSLFAQRSNIFNLKFWRLLSEILRFNRLCKTLVAEKLLDETTTLGQFLQHHDFSDYFAEHYILPMGAAIWSCSLEAMHQFQLEFFVRFFDHHGLLNINDRPQWYVIPGGSKQYIPALTAEFKDKIVLNANIESVTRDIHGALITFKDGRQQHFDEVVLCCHSDQALGLLKDATSQEKAVLGAIPYTQNDVVMHTDISLLPKRKLAWASWNYLLNGQNHQPAAVTYNMNILQGLQSEHTYCVTLNLNQQIDPNKIIGRYQYAHPVFDIASQKARKKRSLICGHNHTHFAGAYWYNGFHEDGVRSAVNVANRLGCFLEQP